MTRFSDLSLHILVHLSGNASFPITALRNAIKTFQVEMLDPLIERGWVTTRKGEKGSLIVSITDAGENWLRNLCDISEEQTKP